MANRKGEFFNWSNSYYLALYVLSLHVLNTNTRSSSPHWKLIVEDGKNIIAPNPSLTLPSGGTGGSEGLLHEPFQDDEGTNNGSYVNSRHNKKKSSASSTGSKTTTSSSDNVKRSDFWISEEDDELVLRILATTVMSPKGSWTKNGHELYCSNCPMAAGAQKSAGFSDQIPGVTQDEFVVDGQQEEVLDCGRPANFTYYDQLIGVANRQSHPHIPEPQVAMVFRKKGSKKDTIDLNTLERKLRKAKKEKPSSVQLYNQIGNFWRIKGHTLRAIECFRRALAVAPNNPEVLHNLARLLLTLQYLDDALFLARRSLELQAPDRSAWQQHFTLGEILKAYGHHQEAVLHFKHTLELRPDHAGAQEALEELETLLAGTGLHICTLLIIIFLVLGVLLVMLSSLENEEPPDLTSRPPPRHFSRALAMRSLKLGISPRALRSKRLP